MCCLTQIPPAVLAASWLTLAIAIGTAMLWGLSGAGYRGILQTELACRFGAVAEPPPAPVANFTGTPLTIDPGQSVSFDSTSSTGEPTGWQWDFNGDAVTDSTEQNPTWTYPTEGDFTVTLMVINMTGVDVAQKVNYVTVGAGGEPPDPPDPPEEPS